MKLSTILITPLIILAACNGVQNTDTDINPVAEDRMTVLPTGWYQVVDSANGVARYLGTDTVFYLNPKPVVSAASFDTMMVRQPYADEIAPWEIVVLLNDAGREAMTNATERLIDKDMAFVVNDTLFMPPVRIRQKIPSGIFTIKRQSIRSKQDAEAVLAKIKGS